MVLPPVLTLLLWATGVFKIEGFPSPCAKKLNPTTITTTELDASRMKLPNSIAPSMELDPSELSESSTSSRKAPNSPWPEPEGDTALWADGH